MVVCKPYPLRAFLWNVQIALSLALGGDCLAQFQAFELPSSPQVDSKVYAVAGGSFGGYSNGQANFWASVVVAPTNLSPNGLPYGGEVHAMVGQIQYGEFGARAAMWQGTPGSHVDLHPSWADASVILDASTQCQVGRTQAFATNFDSRATVWFGTAASAVNLHPAGAKDSTASAAWGNMQGGFVSWLQPVAIGHAALWSGSAASFVDLNPEPGSNSAIAGMSEHEQVGDCASNSTNGQYHAAIWNGTAQSMRDVHPFSNPGSFSALFATCGSAQVGHYNRGTGVKPGIWFGSRDSFLDLYQFLPPGAGESAALCVEEVNGVFTVGGYARYGVNFRPFVWVGVPAPAAALPLLALFIPRRRRSTHTRSPEIPVAHITLPNVSHDQVCATPPHLNCAP